MHEGRNTASNTLVEETRRDKLKWAVIEEPEMGLHPRAISVVLLLVLELLSRGYRVCVSTHSPQVLELVWALGILQRRAAKPERLLELFDIRATPKTRHDRTTGLLPLTFTAGHTQIALLPRRTADDNARAGTGRSTSSRVATLLAGAALMPTGRATATRMMPPRACVNSRT
jgi:hypothetical protein